MSSSSERRSSLPNAEQQLGSTNNDAESVASSRSDASNWRNRFRYSPLKRPFVIGVAGGTASGKSTVCSKIMEKLGPGIDPTSKSKYLSHEKRVVVISQDSFYRKLTDHDRNMVTKGNFNFDHPSAFDVDLMVRTLRDIIYGKMVKIPIYNYLENEISDELEVVYPADVVLVEGLLLFYFPEVRELFNMKIFVDTDPDTRLARRVMRDVNTHKRDIEWVLSQYTKFVKPSFEEFCLPTKKHADIIVPRGNDNEVAVSLIVNHVRSIYDSNIRHPSIKYFLDDEEELKKKHKKGKRKKSGPQRPVTVMTNACDEIVFSYTTNNPVTRSAAIPILRGRGEENFCSLSAPSHMDHLGRGLDLSHVMMNGHAPNGLDELLVEDELHVDGHVKSVSCESKTEQVSSVSVSNKSKPPNMAQPIVRRAELTTC